MRPVADPSLIAVACAKYVTPPLAIHAVILHAPPEEVFNTVTGVAVAVLAVTPWTLLILSPVMTLLLMPSLGKAVMDELVEKLFDHSVSTAPEEANAVDP